MSHSENDRESWQGCVVFTDRVDFFFYLTTVLAWYFCQLMLFLEQKYSKKNGRLRPENSEPHASELNLARRPTLWFLIRFVIISEYLLGDLVSKVTQAYTIWRNAGLSIRGVRTCGDYMFSGHSVVLTMLNFFVTECK